MNPASRPTTAPMAMAIRRSKAGGPSVRLGRAVAEPEHQGGRDDGERGEDRLEDDRGEEGGTVRADERGHDHRRADGHDQAPIHVTAATVARRPPTGRRP